MNKRRWLAVGAIAAVPVALLVVGNVVQRPTSGEATVGTMAPNPWGGPFSDRRLKSEIVRIGTLPSGLPTYEYTIFGRREIGVMADEAEKLFPDAVITGPDGFKRVYYDKIH